MKRYRVSSAPLWPWMDNTIQDSSRRYEARIRNILLVALTVGSFTFSLSLAHADKGDSALVYKSDPQRGIYFAHIALDRSIIVFEETRRTGDEIATVIRNGHVAHRIPLGSCAAPAWRGEVLFIDNALILDKCAHKSILTMIGSGDDSYKGELDSLNAELVRLGGLEKIANSMNVYEQIHLASVITKDGYIVVWDIRTPSKFSSYWIGDPDRPISSAVFRDKSGTAMLAYQITSADGEKDRLAIVNMRTGSLSSAPLSPKVRYNLDSVFHGIWVTEVSPNSLTASSPTKSPPVIRYISDVGDFYKTPAHWPATAGPELGVCHDEVIQFLSDRSTVVGISAVNVKSKSATELSISQHGMITPLGLFVPEEFDCETSKLLYVEHDSVRWVNPTPASVYIQQSNSRR